MSPHLTFGRNTQVSSFCKIKASDGPVAIGQEVSIGASCFISSDRMGVKIGDYCLIGPNVSIIGNNYNYDRLDIPICRQGTQSAGISIEDNVWIGAGTVVLDGASIGQGAIIAPNSVVSARIPENTIAQGNPAKVIFKRR
jgi:acetyltransferase-like isoleucine patch superfamily enzyme